MLNGTITKKHSFVILISSLFLSAAFTLSACQLKPYDSPHEANAQGGAPSRSFGAPEVAGKIEAGSINESSGIAASKCNKDILWTHNDSGDKNNIYALDMSAKLIGKWKVRGAENKDWEDIASVKDESGKCFLYIGDIGDNGEKRLEMAIYRVEEPRISDGSETAEADRIRFRFPDGYRDSETLLVHPLTSDIYVITKTMIGAAEVYRIPSEFNGPPVTAVKVADFSVPAIPEGLLTGGDISPDGRYMVISDYFGGYEFAVPGQGEDFEAVWTQSPVRFDLGARRQGESVCYSADGKSIFATSEKGQSPLIRIDVK